MTTKICTKCKIPKDLERDFYKKNDTRDGHTSQCRFCISSNKQTKEKQRQYREKNKEKKAAQTRKWQKNNRQRVAKSTARWRERNPDKAKEWQKNNPQKRKIIEQRWVKNNPDKVYAKTLNRRLRLKGIPGSHTAQEWEELKKTYDYMCPHCNRREPEIKLTRDHIIPVSRPDLCPTNFISNIQPLCQSCNSKKWNKVVCEGL